MTDRFYPIVSAEQARRDATHERKIVAASLEIVLANTNEGQELAWQRLRALILNRTTSQVLRMEYELGIANLQAAAKSLHFGSAKAAA